MNTIVTRRAMQDLPCFKSQVDDTFTTTNQAFYKDKLVVKELMNPQAPKAPLCASVNFVNEPGMKSIPRASGWTTTSKQTWGKFEVDEALMRAEQRYENALLNTQSLSEPLKTEQPILDIPTSAYFHGPMPDKAITQHFLHRKTTSAVIDGSGQNQTVEIPMEAADPSFCYLRDADGTRRILEIRDTMEPVDLRAHGQTGEEKKMIQRLGLLKAAPALAHEGMTSTYASSHGGDIMRKSDNISKVAEDIRIEKEDAARTAKLYGEENRITIPHVFRHENGLATTDRATEIFMKTREQPKNPPRASISLAKDLIYSSAPPPVHQW